MHDRVLWVVVAHQSSQRGLESKELKYVRIKAQSMIVTFSIASFTSPIMASIRLPSFFCPYNTILQSVGAVRSC